MYIEHFKIFQVNIRISAYFIGKLNKNRVE